MGTAFTLPTTTCDEVSEALDEAQNCGHSVVVELDNGKFLMTADEAAENWEEMGPGEGFTVHAFKTLEEWEAEEARAKRKAEREKERLHQAREAARRPAIEAMRQRPEVLASALEELAERLGSAVTAGDVGPHMTCAEADAVADVLRHSGHVRAAETWLDGHAKGDDGEDDRHRDRETAPALDSY